MTDEGKSDTEKWIADKEAVYPYAYYKGSSLTRFAGVDGIPHAILVNPEGVVVWAGHPGGLTASVIEPHLEGALPMPLFEFPRSASKVKSALLAGKLAAALEAAEALVAAGDEQGAVVKASVEGLVASRVQSLTRARELGDFLRVVERGPPLVTSLGDLPQAAEVAALVAAVEAEERADEVIAGQRKIRDLREELDELSKKRDADRMVGKLEKLAEELAGTYAATEAQELIRELTVRRVKLR